MESKTGIVGDNRPTIATKPGTISADEKVLFTQTKNAGRNTEDNDLYNTCRFFETYFEQQHKITNAVVEHIRSMLLAIFHAVMGYLK